MQTELNNYFSFLIGTSDHQENFNLVNVKKLWQNEFFKFKFEKERYKSKYMSFVISIPLIFLLGFNIYNNVSFFVISTQFLISGLVLDIFLFFLSLKFENSYDRLLLFRYLRFFLFYFNILISLMFTVTSRTKDLNRIIYCGIFLSNFVLIYFLEFNFTIHLLITVINSTCLMLRQFIIDNDHHNLIPELVINLVYFTMFSMFKKEVAENEQYSFVQSYKYDFFHNYTRNFLEVVNGMVVCIGNDDILFVNNFTFSYLRKNIYQKNLTMHILNSVTSLDHELLINSSVENEQVNNINTIHTVQNFLDNLKLDFSSDFKIGDNFKDIIQKFTSENNSNSFNFIKLGNFSHYKLKDAYFEIHARKLSYHKESIELLIYDISEIKIAEKQAIESKYKHKILAKIAHEFKTPLITIISLSERIVKDQQNLFLDNNTKKNLYYINNLSNYSLSLISDIIHYVSNSINLRINKNEVNLNEVMDFSNSVLKTLVECNEHKSQKIKTELVIDKELKNMKLFTDENRLKQILLNFISNAFKFTHEGYIKLKAKFIEESKQVEISVKDTGIGIKEEDHDLIFKENIQLNVNNLCDNQGSGLGLSIVKNMADYLDLKIGFKSTYGKGSKFYILMNPNIKKNRNKLKTISYNNYNSIMKNMILQEVSGNRITDKDLKKNMYVDNHEDSQLNNLIKRKFKDTDDDTTIYNYDLIKYHESNEMTNVLETTSFYFMIGIPKQFNTNVCKLVVVDDNKFIREHTINLLNLLLKDLNISLYDIVECCDGIELLNIIRLDTSNLIKLILVDENMEYLNGSDSVKIIRNLEYNKKIKQYYITSITAFDDEPTKEIIIKSGVDSVINKPCNKSDLNKILDEFFIPNIKMNK